MYTIIGLGNPGSEYQNNRHNIGFMILDSLATRKKLSFKQKGNALSAQRKDFLLIKPQTYMNCSGDVLSGFNGNPTDILVICDDIYLPLGEVRIRCAGGDGGHNGLKSILMQFADDGFCRMRIGVGSPQPDLALPDYVLADFTAEETAVLSHTIAFATTLIDQFLFNGFVSMNNYYSKNKKSYSEKILSESMSKGGT